MSYFIILKAGITARHPDLFFLEKIVRGKILDFERRAWDSFCESHSDMRVAQSCLENVSPFRFWSLADQFPDLVSRFHVQVRLGSRIVMVPFVLFLKRILKV